MLRKQSNILSETKNDLLKVESDFRSQANGIKQSELDYALRQDPEIAKHQEILAEYRDRLKRIPNYRAQLQSDAQTEPELRHQAATDMAFDKFVQPLDPRADLIRNMTDPFLRPIGASSDTISAMNSNADADAHNHLPANVNQWERLFPKAPLSSAFDDQRMLDSYQKLVAKHMSIKSAMPESGTWRSNMFAIARSSEPVLNGVSAILGYKTQSMISRVGLATGLAAAAYATYSQFGSDSK